MIWSFHWWNLSDDRIKMEQNLLNFLNLLNLVLLDKIILSLIKTDAIEVSLNFSSENNKALKKNPFSRKLLLWVQDNLIVVHPCSHFIFNKIFFKSLTGLEYIHAPVTNCPDKKTRETPSKNPED